MSADLIEQAVREYIEQHPDFTPPEKSQHPLVLALTTDMYSPLIHRFGGIIEFWWILLDAAKLWFKPNEASLEYNYFYGRLFGACGLSSDTDFEEEMNEIWQAYMAWQKFGVH